MAYQMENVKILVVEDNEDMLMIMRNLLEAFGVGQVITARNGEDGFTKYCAENPDLIITDWMMQPCDGIMLTERIRRSKESPNQFVPVILMTGFSDIRRVVTARDTGITEYLVKPFNARALYKRMVEIIERPRDFVKSNNFFGPNRRRKKRDGEGEHEGRRETDKS